MRPAYSVSYKSGKSVLITKETLLKNNLNFVKDVPMIYVNFIIIVNVVSAKKNRRHYFHTDLHVWVHTFCEQINIFSTFYKV
jgi:hypothetical protein